MSLSVCRFGPGAASSCQQPAACHPTSDIQACVPCLHVLISSSPADLANASISWVPPFRNLSRKPCMLNASSCIDMSPTLIYWLLASLTCQPCREWHGLSFQVFASATTCSASAHLTAHGMIDGSELIFCPHGCVAHLSNAYIHQSHQYTHLARSDTCDMDIQVNSYKPSVSVILHV